MVSPPDTRHRRVVEFVGFPVLLAAVVQLLSGCGGGRSVEAYCDVFYGEGGELRQRYLDVADSDDPFAQLGAALSSQQELATFFDELEKVAPDDIASDVAALRDEFQQQSDAMGSAAMDPLAGLAAGLLGGASVSGSYERVDEYTSEHCGAPPGD